MHLIYPWFNFFLKKILSWSFFGTFFWHMFQLSCFEREALVFRRQLPPSRLFLKSSILRWCWLGCQIVMNFSSQSRSNHWELFLKIGFHFSQVIIILMWTLVLYWNRSISQEVNNLDNVYFYLKEQVSSSRIWGRLDIIFFCKQNITEKLISPVIDNLGEQLKRLDFPGHGNLLNLEEWL